jgi:hypothetical protein
LSTWLISALVVGGVVVGVTRLVTDEALQPATGEPLFRRVGRCFLWLLAAAGAALAAGGAAVTATTRRLRHRWADRRARRQALRARAPAQQAAITAAVLHAEAAAGTTPMRAPAPSHLVGSTAVPSGSAAASTLTAATTPWAAPAIRQRPMSRHRMKVVARRNARRRSVKIRWWQRLRSAVTLLILLGLLGAGLAAVVVVVGVALVTFLRNAVG